MKDYKRLQTLVIGMILLFSVMSCTTKAQNQGGYYFSNIEEVGFIDTHLGEYQSEKATGFFMTKNDFTSFAFSFDSQNYGVDEIIYTSRADYILEGEYSTYIEGRAIDKEGNLFNWSVTKTNNTNKIKEFTMNHENDPREVLYFQME